jgi:Zn-dependent M28 family amino/carboxypeptidase
MEIPVNQDRLYQDVLYLTSIDPPRNYQNLDSLENIAQYILQTFEKLDCKTDIQSYLAVHPQLVPDGQVYKNIIATFGPDTQERIIIGAHYDVDGDQPGADDNASAVAGLLEIARLIDELKPVLKYRVDLVAYCLEESPFFYSEFMGSAVHAKSMKDQNIPLKAMICLEMIGYFRDEPNSQKFPIEAMKAIYPSTGNFITVVGRDGQENLTQQIKQRMLEGSTIDVQSLTAPPQMLKDITRSDHSNYWNQGFEAVMITDTSFLRNPHYHQKTDTIDTLDFKRMAEVVKGVYWALVNL